VRYPDRRNFPERADAHRTQDVSRRTLRRTRFVSPHRINRPTRHHIRAHEDRYTCPHRCTERRLLVDGNTRRGKRFPPLLLHQRAAPPEAIAMLDMLYQRRSARRFAERACRLPSL
jgi:hypothetical protein